MISKIMIEYIFNEKICFNENITSYIYSKRLR